MTKEQKQRIIDAKLRYDSYRFPNTPPIGEYKHTDTTASGLTHCINDFLFWEGWLGERVNVMGTPEVEYFVDGNTGTKLGRVKGVKYRKTTGTVGSADQHSTIMGKAVKFEVKMKDKQSADQKRYAAKQRVSGGEYHIVHNMGEVFEQYDRITADDTDEAKAIRIAAMAEIARQEDQHRRKRQPPLPVGSITSIEQL